MGPYCSADAALATGTCSSRDSEIHVTLGNTYFDHYGGSEVEGPAIGGNTVRIKGYYVLPSDVDAQGASGIFGASSILGVPQIDTSTVSDLSAPKREVTRLHMHTEGLKDLQLWRLLVVDVCNKSIPLRRDNFLPTDEIWRDSLCIHTQTRTKTIKDYYEWLRYSKSALTFLRPFRVTVGANQTNEQKRARSHRPMQMHAHDDRINDDDDDFTDDDDDDDCINDDDVCRLMTFRSWLSTYGLHPSNSPGMRNTHTRTVLTMTMIVAGSRLSDHSSLPGGLYRSNTPGMQNTSRNR